MINEEFQNENETHINNQYFINMWKSNKLFNDDYIRLTNSFWFEFMPPNAYTCYIWGILYAIVMILGCTGNVLAIFMILKVKSLKAANIFMLNLAIGDIILLANTSFVIYNSYYQGPALGNLGCQIDGFTGTLARSVSTISSTAIAMDRFNPIIHPLKSLGRQTKRKARIRIGLIWICGFMFAIIPLLDIDYGFAPAGFLLNCTIDFMSSHFVDKFIIIIFYIIGSWLLPTITVLYCYIMMSISVYTISEANSSRIGYTSTKKKKKIIFGIMTTSTIVLYVFSLTPYSIVIIFGVLEKKEFITPIIMALSALSNIVCSSLNPWIYIILPKTFENYRHRRN